ncbi:MAG: nicotinate-nucleotide adenylyltransferase [Desulfuromonadales bacterium]|nr:nicotinate-nucleotide adenylyltransferase [Desulfuromonadales bacterium]
MKTGILGGTFNPIHQAHLQIAQDVLATCKLDRVLFIPAAQPPHKEVAGAVSFAHRLAMVQAAIADFPQFEVSDIELQRAGKSYSVDTLELLKQNDPTEEFFFIIGLDSWRDIASWKDSSRLFGLAHIVVITRPGIALQHPLEPLPVAMRQEFCYHEGLVDIPHKSGNSLLILTEKEMAVSSTDIRHRVSQGQPIRHLAPAPVVDYIERHGLFASPKL